MAERTGKQLAWPLFDSIVGRAEMRHVNPWVEGIAGPTFEPDYGTLRTLLGVPLHLGTATQSGVPALAIDVWVAYELRRAGLDPDSVWPRETPPRVVSRDVLRFVESLPAADRERLLDRLKSQAIGGVAAASANIMGKNYLKQVDVIVSSWQVGPELLISTKRMDSSFGKNAANRVEESYGDAKNLALRHPLAARGFVFALRSTAYTEERRHFDWIVDLLTKLGREEDAYDACMLLVPHWSGAAPDGDAEGPDEAVLEPDEVDTESGAVVPSTDVESVVARLPQVSLRRDLVPRDLDPGRFFSVMIAKVLDGSTVTHHEEARRLRAEPRA